MDSIREEVRSGRVKTPAEIRAKLKQSIISVLQPQGKTSELQLSSGQKGVIFVVGVNGGGKTTTIGKLAHKLGQGGAKVKIRGRNDNFSYIAPIFCPLRAANTSRKLQLNVEYILLHSVKAAL